MASEWQANGYVYLLQVIFILLLILVVLTWKRRKAPGSRYLTYLLAAAGMWSITYAVQLGFEDLNRIHFWARARYIWIAMVPPFWFLFAENFAHGRTHSSLRSLILQSIEPILVNVLIWSSSGDLFMTVEGAVRKGSVVFIDFNYGTAFWLHSIYSYLLIAVGSIVLTRALWVKRAVYRGQLGMLGVGILAPWIGNALSILELLPTPQFDVTPFTLLITGVAMLFGLYRFQLLDLLPVAQETIFRNMGDGVIVLDAGRRVTDTNPAVRVILGLNEDLPSGRFLSSAAPELARLIEFDHGEKHWKKEIKLYVNGSYRDLDVQVSRVLTGDDETAGWLISLHDITALKQSEAALRTRARQISILNEISSSANRIQSVEELLEMLSRKLLDLMEADSCVILRNAPAYAAPVLGRADRPETPNLLDGAALESANDILASAVEAGSLLLQGDAAAHGAGNSDQALTGGTILAGALSSAEEILGLVLVAYRDRFQPDQELWDLYEHAVEQTALALARVVLLEELEARVEERTAALEESNQELEEEISQRIFYEQELSVKARDLEMNQLDIIWRLANAGEFRDSETGNHVVRVGYYSWMIARQLGLDEDFCRTIFLTSPLHDIGKIGIPDEILMKPSDLTEAERLRMMEHCLIGANILMSNPVGLFPARIAGLDPPVEMSGLHVSNPFIEMAASIALSHHEHWDGNGYPMEIAGEDIPMEARIVAVADVFDALISRRRYKPAYSLEHSVSTLEESAGAQFDPAVVDAFRAAVHDLEEVHKQFSD